MSGYPRMLLFNENNILFLQLLLSVMFMMPFRKEGGYKQDYSPDVVYNIMNKDRGNLLIRNYWISSFSLWVLADWLGSRINDGSICISQGRERV